MTEKKPKKPVKKAKAITKKTAKQDKKKKSDSVFLVEDKKQKRHGELSGAGERALEELGGIEKIINIIEKVASSEQGIFVVSIANALGIHRSTLYKIMDNHPEIKEAIDQAKRQDKDYVGSKLWELINGVKVEYKQDVYKDRPSLGAIQTWLTMNGYYSQKIETNNKTEVSNSLEVSVKGLSDEQLLKELEGLNGIIADGQTKTSD